MPSKIKIAKNVIGFIAAAGASTIVKTIIADNVVPTKKYQIVTVFVGTVVIGYMASDAVEKYTHQKIDEFVGIWQKIKTELAAN